MKKAQERYSMHLGTTSVTDMHRPEIQESAVLFIPGTQQLPETQTLYT